MGILEDLFLWGLKYYTFHAVSQPHDFVSDNNCYRERLIMTEDAANVQKKILCKI